MQVACLRTSGPPTEEPQQANVEYKEHRLGYNQDANQQHNCANRKAETCFDAVIDSMFRNRWQLMRGHAQRRTLIQVSQDCAIHNEQNDWHCLSTTKYAL